MVSFSVWFFCFKYTASSEIYPYGHPLSLHDALPIVGIEREAVHAVDLVGDHRKGSASGEIVAERVTIVGAVGEQADAGAALGDEIGRGDDVGRLAGGDRKSTRLNSSH